MKKNIFYGIAVAILAAVAAWNVSLGDNPKNALTDLQLANVEALATEEGDSCSGGNCSWQDSFGNQCSACCPTGKNPMCNSMGCACR
jgi:hypothetical protein